MPDPLSVWREGFFHERSYLDSRPDGRHLYAYRLSETEFRSLEGSLQQKLAVHSLVGHDRDFSGLFVLYAAEWWRRRYQGKRWTWEPILADLGLEEDAWSAAERSDCVDRGLCYWGLNKSKAGGLRYLKSIALQGGLPMALLAEARGKLGQLLGKVLIPAKTGTHGTETLRSWIESLATSLPQAYREEVIYDLLAELVQATLELARKAGLTSSTDAVARLDQWNACWRDQFPVPVGDREAQGLIEQLMRDAAAPAAPPPARLVVSRWLEAGNDGFWTLHSGMELPDKLSRQELGELFSGDDGERFFKGLGRTPTLRLESSDQALSWPLQRLAGHDAFRVVRCRPLALGREAAGAEHRLLLQSVDGVGWLAAARRGEALDPELPWLFEETEGQPPPLGAAGWRRGCHSNRPRRSSRGLAYRTEGASRIHRLHRIPPARDLPGTRPSHHQWRHGHLAGPHRPGGCRRG